MANTRQAAGQIAKGNISGGSMPSSEIVAVTEKFGSDSSSRNIVADATTRNGSDSIRANVVLPKLNDALELLSGVLADVQKAGGRVVADQITINLKSGKIVTGIRIRIVAPEAKITMKREDGELVIVAEYSGRIGDENANTL